MKQKVLFICTHNSARSQIAEGLLRDLYGNIYDVYSAGTAPSGVNPHALGVLKEAGVDVAGFHSKSIDSFKAQEIDYVVTLCDSAKQECPFFRGGKTHMHKSFEDPSQFKGSKEDTLNVFRRVRDEIRHWIEETFNLHPMNS